MVFLGDRHGTSFSPGMRYMVAGAFAFALMSLGVKMAGARLPSQEIVLIRGLLTLAFTAAMLRRAGVSVRSARPGVLMLRGLFGFAALSCIYHAVVRLPLADATVLQYTNPIWTAILAVWVLGERMRRWEVALVVASLAGVVLIARPTALFGGVARLDLAAVAIALAGALFSGAAYVTVRKLGRTEHPLVIVFYFTLVTVPGAVPGTLMGAYWPTAREWLLLLGIGVTAQVGQVCLTRALQLEPAGRATAVGYVQVVFAGLLGAIFFGEVPDRWAVAGGAVVLGSTLLLTRAHAGTVSPARAADESITIASRDPEPR